MSTIEAFFSTRLTSHVTTSARRSATAAVVSRGGAASWRSSVLRSSCDAARRPRVGLQPCVVEPLGERVARRAPRRGRCVERANRTVRRRAGQVAQDAAERVEAVEADVPADHDVGSGSPSSSAADRRGEAGAGAAARASRAARPGRVRRSSRAPARAWPAMALVPSGKITAMSSVAHARRQRGQRLELGCRVGAWRSRKWFGSRLPTMSRHGSTSSSRFST